MAFVSYSTNITAFNLNSGQMIWNYSAAPSSSLFLISYSNGGGLVAKTTTGSVARKRRDFRGRRDGHFEPSEGDSFFGGLRLRARLETDEELRSHADADRYVLAAILAVSNVGIRSNLEVTIHSCILIDHEPHGLRRSFLELVSGLGRGIRR